MSPSAVEKKKDETSFRINKIIHHPHKRGSKGKLKLWTGKKKSSQQNAILKLKYVQLKINEETIKDSKRPHFLAKQKQQLG